MVSFVVAEETEAEVWPRTPLVHAKILVSTLAAQCNCDLSCRSAMK